MYDRRFFGLVAIPLALAGASCRENTTAMTSDEARTAVDEAALSTEAEDVTGGSIEIATNFTIGGAVDAAAKEIQTFVTTQLPCADVALSGATLTITYGAKPGNCTYKGHTYSGTHAITVAKNDMSDIVVDHTWTKLSNGTVEVTGTAEVTWSPSQKSRHVTHELTWTRLSDGRTGTGTGDRTQTPLSGGIDEGIQVDGQRTWKGADGQWDLAIEGVQMRWADPVPQAGAYRLASPKNRSLTLSFARVDDTTIRVTLKSGTQSFSFNVKKGGSVSSGA